MSEDPREQTLSVLTLNAWALPWSRHRRRRLRALTEWLRQRGDDLVGLQEMWGGSLQHVAHRLQHGRERRDSGLAVGGHLELRDRPRVRAFRRARGPDALKGKGVLSAVAHLEEDSAIRVLVTHLQAGWRHGDVRAHQVDEILERTQAAADLPTVLIGDFNLHAEHAEDERSHRRLLSAGFRDVAEETGATEPTFHSANRYVVGRGRAERFDRIYVRCGRHVALEAVEAAVLEHEHPLSDHHPLWARLVARTRDP